MCDSPLRLTGLAKLRKYGRCLRNVPASHLTAAVDRQNNQGPCAACGAPYPIFASIRSISTWDQTSNERVGCLYLTNVEGNRLRGSDIVLGHVCVISRPFKKIPPSSTGNHSHY